MDFRHTTLLFTTPHSPPISWSGSDTFRPWTDAVYPRHDPPPCAALHKIPQQSTHISINMNHFLNQDYFHHSTGWESPESAQKSPPEVTGNSPTMPNDEQKLPIPAPCGASPVEPEKVSTSTANNFVPNGNGKGKRPRTTFTGHQLTCLEQEFRRQEYIGGLQRLELAGSLGLTEGQVKVWWQNRRIKHRKAAAMNTRDGKQSADPRMFLLPQLISETLKWRPVQ